MKIIKRNKQKMSVAHEQAKDYFCNLAHICTDEDSYSLLIRMYWYEGHWCGVIWDSVYGETHNFVGN